MRKIKFRFWNPLENLMTYSAELETLEGFFCHFNNGNNFLMQFTGLLDSTGKEIYEDDILKNEANNYQCRITNEMFFNCGCCIDVYGWNIPLQIETYKIIGNIHENPELMEIK